MAASNPVPKLYQSVIDDVVTNVREAFLDDGVDEQILQELRQLWESKLNQSKAVDPIASDNKERMGLYAQQQQTLLQQKQKQQQNAASRQVAQASPSQPTPGVAKPATITSNTPATVSQQVQLPMFNQATGQFEVSGAAAQAQSALGGLIPGGTVTLQTPNGPMQFIIQAPAQQQQAGTVTLPAGVVTTQNLGQVDGQQDDTSDSSEGTTHQDAGVSRARVPQTDGRHDTSSEEDDEDDDDNDDDDDQNDDDNQDREDEEEEDPLNSGDDVSDEDPAELFDTDNVVVCQFDKINRAKNRWKFHLKDGIMNLNGRDLVFQKCNGDAEW